MSRLTKAQVKHIAELSNLSLTDHEVVKFTPQLSKILDFVNMLQEVNTNDTEPVSQTTGLFNVFHKDEVLAENILAQDQALSGTEETHNGLFKVKAILKGRTDK